MLNTVMKNKHKRFTNISIFSEIIVACMCEHSLRKEIRTVVYLFLLYGQVFKMMKLKTKSKEGKTMVKD